MSGWIQTAVTLAGFVGGMIMLYVKLTNRITGIEAKLKAWDENKPERVELDRSRATDAAKTFCREDCPRAGQIGGTNPRIQAYTGEVQP